MNAGNDENSANVVNRVLVSERDEASELWVQVKKETVSSPEVCGEVFERLADKQQVTCIMVSGHFPKSAHSFAKEPE